MKGILFGIILATILLIGSAQALNLWMSNDIFNPIEVQPGFRGYTGKQISWGTFDNATYDLEVSITGNAKRFFKKLSRSAVIGPGRDNKYQYLIKLNIPRKAKPGDYSFTICGKVTYTWYSLALCKSGMVVI